MIELKSIPDFEGYYCDKQGNVYSNKKYRLDRLKNHLAGAGYVQVNLWKNNKAYHKYIHRLLLELFISPSKNGYECNHKDGNKQNNSIDNLEWVTKSQNQRHRVDVLGKGNKKGINAKLTPEDVKEIIRLKTEERIPYIKIAPIFGVDRSTIARYLQINK